MPNVTIFLCLDLPLTVIFHHPPPAVAASSLKWVQLDLAFHKWWFSSEFSNILRNVDIDNSIMNKDRTMLKICVRGSPPLEVELFKTLHTYCRVRAPLSLFTLGRVETPNNL